MKSRNIFVYTILAIGILSIPSLLDTVQAQTNSTNQTSAQNQTMSKDTQALMTIDLPELKDTLMNAKNALANNDTEEALTSVTDVENQMLTLQPQPKFTADFQKIKDAVSKNDVNKALDDLTKVQSDLLKAETEMLKAQLANPMLSQQNNGPQDKYNNGDGDDGGDNGTN